MEDTERVTKEDHSFVDILEKRRVSSDILWASRDWKPVCAYNQPFKYNASQIKSIVFESYFLRKTLMKISRETQVPLSKLYDEVLKILQEMGYERKVPVLRWLGLFVAKILKKLCSALYVNESKFLKIKSQMGSNPVLFVPSHKSYGDFILMSYICFNYEVDIPRIAAGMDFHSMAIMGTILRDACAFFMRRSFIYDQLYSAVFSQYVQTLVTDGDAVIEFFIEGTRSRTSKSLMPKYGFLSTTLKPFFIGLVPDITVVPVNLSYDRVLEEILFAYELLGVPKPKESTKGFVKALSVLKENYGNIYVQFGDPFSVKDYFNDKIDRSVHGFGSVYMQELTTNESKQIIDLAHTIVYKQRELTVLTHFNLISAVINNKILSGYKCFIVNDLLLEVNWLFSIMKTLTPKSSWLLIHEFTKENVLDHLKLHKSLIYLSADEKVQLCRIHSKNALIDNNKLKGHALSNSTMDVAIPLLMLQNYVNPCAHFVVGLCFIAHIVHFMPENSSLSIDELFKEYQLLCSIFSYEFVLYKEFIYEDFKKVLKQSSDLKIVLNEKDYVKKGDNNKLHSFCINFLKSFIPGYLTVTEVLLEFCGCPILEKELLKTCQERVEIKLNNNNNVIHPSNLSLDLLSNAIHSFVALGAVLKVKGTDGIKYEINEPELKKINLKLTLLSDNEESIYQDMNEQFSSFIKSSL